MLLMVSTVMITYGFLVLQLKDLLWFDTVLTARLFGRIPVRTDTWDRRHDQRGMLLMGIGGALLLVWVLTIPL